MARAGYVFRPTVVSYYDQAGRQCPKSEAVLYGDDGQPIMRMIEVRKDGKTKTKSVPALKPGYKRVEGKAPTWHGAWEDENGKECREVLHRNKAAAKILLRKKQNEVEEIIKSGPNARRRVAPLAEHVEAFQSFLAALNNTRRHVEKTVQRVRAIIAGCGFTLAADIDADRVQEWLAEQRRGRMVKDKVRPGWSICSSNHHLRAMKRFTRWLDAKDCVRKDPLRGAKMLNADTDRRHERRAVSDEEFSRLLDAARAGLPFYGLTGPERAMLYAVAVSTGFRVGELASVTPRSFDLDARTPSLTVAARSSKRRRTDTNPIPPQLVPALQKFLADKPDVSPIWQGKWKWCAAEMLRKDLGTAGIAYRDRHGKVFDFHAIRGQFITVLARAGVPLGTTQTLARHSTPVLTKKAYTHLELRDLAAAVATVPDLPAMSRLALPAPVPECPEDLLPELSNCSGLAVSRRTTLPHPDQCRDRIMAKTA
jgi:integrase